MGNHLGLGSRTRNENRTTVLPGDRNISNHGPSAQTRAVATSSTDRAPNLTNYPVPPHSVSTALTGNYPVPPHSVSTALTGTENSSRPLSATSSTDRAPNLTNYHVPPRSGSTAQTGRRNTTPNIPGGSTNSRGNRSANS